MQYIPGNCFVSKFCFIRGILVTWIIVWIHCHRIFAGWPWLSLLRIHKRLVSTWSVISEQQPNEHDKNCFRIFLPGFIFGLWYLSVYLYWINFVWIQWIREWSISLSLDQYDDVSGTTWHKSTQMEWIELHIRSPNNHCDCLAKIRIDVSQNTVYYVCQNYRGHFH